MSQPAPMPAPSERPSRALPLFNGDRLTRAEFERRFDATPGLKRAELVNGITFMSPPVYFEDHAQPHFNIVTLLGIYRMSTPGVVGGDNGSVRVDDQNMPQPDVCLLIDSKLGGQTRIVDGYLEGAPEFVVEIAASSASIDLHLKLDLYRRHGVREYVVWRTIDEQLDFFSYAQSDYVPLPPELSGEIRSKIMPGLWLDVPAILAGEWPKAIETMQRGIASPEHAAFVKELAARRAKAETEK